MSQKNYIYTPTETNPFVNYQFDQQVIITVKETGKQYLGIVWAFPRNNYSDKDYRIVIRPIRSAHFEEWVGSITISAENNFYGYHISEVEID